MGIQSTRNVSREVAVKRILTISNLVQAGDYKGIEAITDESDYDLKKFVDAGVSVYALTLIDKWTDEMVENKLDEPFFRFSMFENYFLEED